MKCICKPGQARDNCPQCEGTGERIDFAALRGARSDNNKLAQLAGLSPSPVSGTYRTPDGKAQIEWELKHGENGPEFSAMGEYDGGAGQCLDYITKAYPDDPAVCRIVAVWRKWHLNGMNAGTPEQVAALEAANLKTPGRQYEQDVLTLKNAGLYEVFPPESIAATGGMPDEIATAEQIKSLLGFTPSGPGHATALHIIKARGYKKRGYRYGERWLYNPIPADVIAEIKSWSDFGPGDGRSLGECKADAFLAQYGIACRITLADAKPAHWSPSGHHYRVTLSAKGRRLAFDFWGSAHDMETGKHPSAYDILSCAASDLNAPETFEDYCSEYGDDSDSIKAKQTFTRANRHAQKLRAFFETDEQAQLSQIN